MILHWQQYVLARRFPEPRGWELQNMLTVAAVMIAAARQREESRGVHYRTDFPGTDDERWRRHIKFHRQADGTIAASLSGIAPL
jgi:L-aspartate oxidase